MTLRVRLPLVWILSSLLLACASGKDGQESAPALEAAQAAPPVEAAPAAEILPAEPLLAESLPANDVASVAGAAEEPQPELSAGDEDDGQPAGPDGPTLYLHNCSGCHGESGKGDGETARQLGVQARSFAEGRFSFGNAPEDIFRTLSSGIPGRSVMPGFKGTLSEEERWAIVAFVRTLMPPSDAAEASGTILEVRERAAIARGKLPPIAEGAPERPQGLLVGTPAGVTFEYAIDEVRLLGVRQGRFADRTDWNDRGGGFLKPLGQTFYLFNGGQPDQMFALWPAGEAPTGLTARLLATEIDGTKGVLEYALHAKDGVEVARIQEHLAAEGLSSGAAFTREVRVMPVQAGVRIAMLVAGSGKAQFPEQADVPFRDGWLVSAAHEGVHEAVHLRLPEGAHVGAGAPGVFVAFQATPGASLHVTLALTADASEAMLAKLAAEIGR